MKIDIISDTHIDFWVKDAQRTGKNKRFIEQRIKRDGDYIIIAGDISHGMKSGKAFLKQLKNFYDRVIIVFGNHDYYMPHSEQDRYVDYKEKIADYTKQLQDLGIDVLNGNTIEIDGVKIFGTDFSYAKNLRTVWTPYMLGGMWYDGMNDSVWIKGLRGDRHEYSYNNNIELFESEYNKLYTNDLILADIVVTHISPLNDKRYIEERFRNDILTGCFCFNGSHLVEMTTAKYWICGHQHKSKIEDIAGTSVVCNALGYPSFEKNAKTITLEI